MKNHVSVEHCPEFETSIEFDYPTEHLPADIVADIEKLTSELVRVKTLEAIRRIVLLLEDDSNPKLTLQALFYSVGFIRTDTNGSLTSHAAALKISKQRFSYRKLTIGKKMEKRIKELSKSDLNPFR